MSANLVSAQDSVATKPIVDVVWLKDGSKLSGTIMKWELARGMELKLITGAIVQIPKEEIVKVYQDLPFSSQSSLAPELYPRGPKPYAFREEGLYQTFSGFISFSEPGGAGIHYSIGHRFNRMLGVGIGVGFESNDFWYTRNMVPLYAEARGLPIAETNHTILCIEGRLWIRIVRSDQRYTGRDRRYSFLSGVWCKVRRSYRKLLSGA